MQSGDWMIINAREYRIGPVLSTGAGSYGQVWAATDADGHAVALKLINTEAMTQADPTLHSHWHAHLEREIAFLDTLKATPSPHIVTLIDHGQVDQQPALVLERLQANLGQWLTQQRRASALPDLAQILDWAKQILDGLDVVHEAGFVYRDLKFSNILVGENGALLKLADFGSLKRENGDNTQSFIGTPATMAPEQILPARQGAMGCEYAVDYRADYYALGLLLFTLLTDQPATAAQRRLGQLLALHGQEGAGQQREQLGGLNDEEWDALRQSIEYKTAPTGSESAHSGAALPLAHLIVRLLARDPDDRPADSLEIRAVLDAVRADQFGALTLTPEWNAPPPPHKPPNWRPHRHGPHVARSRRRAALFAGVLGLAGAVAWAIMQPDDEMRPEPSPSSRTAIAPPTPVIANAPEPIAAPTQQESPATAMTHRFESRFEPGADRDPTAPVPLAPAEPPPRPKPLAVPEPESSAVVATPIAPVVREPPAPTRPQPLARVKPVKPASASAVAHERPAAVDRSSTVAKPTAPADRPSNAPPVTPTIATPVLNVAKPVPKPTVPATPSFVRRSPQIAKATPKPVARANSVASTTTARSPIMIQPQAKLHPVANAEARTRPAPPELPPIQLESRPRAPSSAPPIELVSRPNHNSTPLIARAEPPPKQIAPPIELVSRPNRNATPASTVPTPPIARAEPPSPRAATTPPAQSDNPIRNPIRQFKNDAGRAITGIRHQAESFTHWVNRASATVGTEVQRGLETADRTVSQWTGRCPNADGCPQKTQVERRDRWSSRYGGGAVSPPNGNEAAINPAPRQPQAYR